MKTTITDKTILLSKKGMKELKKNIAQLEHDKQKALQALREIDKTLDHDGRLDQIEKVSYLESIEAKLEDKRLILSSARLLPTRRARLRVALGSMVDLIDKQGHLLRFTLVDSLEADPSDGRISILSPLGRNLIGKTVRDIVECCNGKRTNQFWLIRIV